MANPNPNTSGLSKGRGKRPKLDNETVCMRLSEEDRKSLEKIAEQYGCIYGGKPWLAGLFRMIGSGELLVLPAPPKIDLKDSARKRTKKKFSS
ncbi:hypothetical protein HRE53_30875 (plasmid) [Acaryochloris sp. 'Moss Beach']|uniref:hypothetical protein n=1 Tax=Acaryochloris sp. 'Moss Beach' TaxID=2740837 RepID=UPI001F40FB6F|nr:hypothetical protein [Acaryochloris sp. 'Moss Beach']UJB73119.1 hypothetical protein HRE53_30875 [Acaryochloris sp. 'Moss Beach']